MWNRYTFFVIFLLIFSSCALVFSNIQAEGLSEEARKHLVQKVNFDKWPGKNGPLKAGFKFIKADFVALNPYAVTIDKMNSSDLLRLGSSSVVRREIMLEKGDEKIQIDIRVASWTDEAQREILSSVVGLQAGFAFVFGKARIDGLGDVNFISKGRAGLVYFVRNNVAILISDQGGENSHTTLDLRQFAVEIDNKIKAQPDVTAAQLAAKKPEIKKLESKLEEFVMSDKDKRESPLTIEAVDPSGETLKLFVGGDFSIKEENGKYTAYNPFSVRHAGRVIATAVNESLLCIQESIGINVQAEGLDGYGQEARKYWAQETDFDNWPGKNGPLKAGFRFLKEDYAILNWHSVIFDRFEAPDFSSNASLARRTISIQEVVNENVVIEIVVSSLSTDRAQEELLGPITGTSMGFRMLYGQGNIDGLGDINFIPRGGRGPIHFVRNNVAITIRDQSKYFDNPTTLDLRQLAVEIDNKIKAQPDVTAAQLDAKKPEIKKLESKLEEFVLSDRDKWESPLTLEAVDPSGETLKFFFGGDFSVKEENGKYTAFSPFSIKGKGKVNVIAVNESLLFSQKSIEIKVKE